MVTPAVSPPLLGLSHAISDHEERRTGDGCGGAARQHDPAGGREVGGGIYLGERDVHGCPSRVTRASAGSTVNSSQA